MILIVTGCQCLPVRCVCAKQSGWTGVSNGRHWTMHGGSVKCENSANAFEIPRKMRTQHQKHFMIFLLLIGAFIGRMTPMDHNDTLTMGINHCNQAQGFWSYIFLIIDARKAGNCDGGQTRTRRGIDAAATVDQADSDAGDGAGESSARGGTGTIRAMTVLHPHLSTIAPVRLQPTDRTRKTPRGWPLQREEGKVEKEEDSREAWDWIEQCWLIE